jgi:hypothetical protein
MKIPPEIDIKNIPLPDAGELVAELLKGHSEKSVTAKDDQLSHTHITMQKALISLANECWRVEGLIIDQETGDVKETMSTELKRLCSTLERMKETLTSIGINVIDRTGEAFNPGLPDQVVTEEPKVGISTEQITRTIKPTIIWQQTMVQRGEIEIAVPASK